jgi:hypothetical protein
MGGHDLLESEVIYSGSTLYADAVISSRMLIPTYLPTYHQPTKLHSLTSHNKMMLTHPAESKSDITSVLYQQHKDVNVCIHLHKIWSEVMHHCTKSHTISPGRCKVGHFHSLILSSDFLAPFQQVLSWSCFLHVQRSSISLKIWNIYCGRNIWSK